MAAGEAGEAAATEGRRRVPNTSWAAFARALDHLAQGPLPKRISRDLLGLEASSAKQVHAALGCLGLISEHGEPTIELRRLVDGDRSVITRCVRGLYPELMDLLDNDAPADNVYQQILGYTGESGADRFRTFILKALEDDTEHPEKLAPYRRKLKTAPRHEESSQRAAGAGPAEFVRLELDQWLRALEAALEAGRFDTAERVSDKLERLRGELARIEAGIADQST